MPAWGRFTNRYADQYAEHGVRMNTIQPGFVENYEADQPARNRIPMGRPARTLKIAAIVSYLLTDDSSSITG